MRGENMSAGKEIKEPAYRIVQRAFKWYFERENAAYFYGAKGELLTDEVMDYFIRAEPEHFSRYSEEELRHIKDFSRGKIGFDCSGFVSACLGLRGWSSAALFAKCTERTTVEACKAGSLLYRKGHIGIDIGSGACMMIGIEGRTIEIVPNTSQGFEYGCEWPDADYNEMSNH